MPPELNFISTVLKSPKVTSPKEYGQKILGRRKKNAKKNRRKN